MECTRLRDYLDSDMYPELPPEVRVHLAECDACRREWVLAERVSDTLRRLPSPLPPAGFAERALDRAYRDEARHRQAVRGWSLALAATFVLGVGIGAVLHRGGASAGTDGYALQDGTVTLAPDSTTTVRIALDSGRAIRDVDFVIDIPAGMELQGHPGEQQVAWHGELKQGHNVLGLPLVAKAGASGILEAQLHHDGRDDVLKVHVVTSGGTGWWRVLQRAFT